MNYNAQCGDIFLCDSDRIGAKIVKELMKAPTIWQWIWRQFRGTQEEVRYYHAGMILDEKITIEQQNIVKYKETDKILSRRISIYRYINYKNVEILQKMLTARAIEDIGKKYSIFLTIGKALTWLTGIKWFTRNLGKLTKENEICVSRVAEWYWGISDFGLKYHQEITTKIMDSYCLSHPEEWEIVYQNE